MLLFGFKEKIQQLLTPQHVTYSFIKRIDVVNTLDVRDAYRY